MHVVLPTMFGPLTLFHLVKQYRKFLNFDGQIEIGAVIVPAAKSFLLNVECVSIFEILVYKKQTFDDSSNLSYVNYSTRSRICTESRLVSR